MIMKLGSSHQLTLCTQEPVLIFSRPSGLPPAHHPRGDGTSCLPAVWLLQSADGCQALRALVLGLRRWEFPPLVSLLDYRECPCGGGGGLGPCRAVLRADPWEASGDHMLLGVTPRIGCRSDEPLSPHLVLSLQHQRDHFKYQAAHSTTFDDSGNDLSPGARVGGPFGKGTCLALGPPGFVPMWFPEPCQG